MKLHASLLVAAGAALLASSVHAAGEQTCGGGLLGGDCPAGSFCSYPVGLCGDAQSLGSSQTGTCKPLPEMCTQDISPVCACNGRGLETFPNECMANTKGYSVQSVGECPKTAGGILGGNGDGLLPGLNNGETTPTTPTGTSTTECGGPSKTQCAAGYVCIYKAGNECGAAGGVGRCEAAGGKMCTKEYVPVCGCDGKTYSNACVAQYEHGVSVFAQGECGKTGILNPPVDASGADDSNTGGAGGLFEPRACGGPSGKTCPFNQFCKFPEGACATGNPTPEGVCAQKPLTCSEHTLPSVTQVCGCSQTTYRTECHANREGESVLYRGACFSQAAAAANEEANPKVCGGKNALLAKRCLAQGEFCEYQQGVCGNYDAVGACSAKPEVCAEVVDPVCGCDGKSYPSPCAARRSGVSIKSKGNCPNLIHTIDDGIGGLGTTNKYFDIFATNSTTGLCNPKEGAPCPEGYYCAFEPGKCLVQKEMGLCRVQPAECTPSSDSGVVCGCSGSTYATKCDAAMAGESLMAESSCVQLSSGAIASGSAARGVVVTAFAMAAAGLALAGLV